MEEDAAGDDDIDINAAFSFRCRSPSEYARNIANAGLCAGLHTFSLALALFLMILRKSINLGSEGVCDLLLVLFLDSPVRSTGWQTWQTYAYNISHLSLLSGARSAVQPAAPPAELFRDAVATFQRARSIELP